MHIALLSAEYPPQPGGIGDYTRQLGQALHALGHTVHVLTIAEQRVQIIGIGHAADARPPAGAAIRADWGWRSWRAIGAALAWLKPDVLHIQYQTGAYAMHPAINLLPWRLRHMKPRPPIVVTAHDLLLPYLFPKAGHLRGWVTRRLVNDADAVVATNAADVAQINSYRRRATDRHPPVLIPIGSNIAVAPPAGYDRAAWRAQLQITPAQTLLVYFGLISRSKGLDVVLHALAQLPEDLRLLIVGGAATAPDDRAYAAEIERMIARLGLTPRVIKAGHCDAPKVSAHLLAADLAVLPFSDGASLRRGSLLAALSHGLPLITTVPAEQVTQQFVDGVNMLLIPPNDAPALVRAVTRASHDHALQAKLADGGRSLAAQFSWPAIAAQHAQLYAELVKK